ncbi:unnamed protein product [Brachionus calyciflorus]|uniref:Uncharacterized protein n=1 Tax=Brachionus calyciflorus TaxID=104777 RepID=A0A813ZV35_9BILA|nr:unnamed protein product [Brachionus calyciflorus]
MSKKFDNLEKEIEKEELIENDIPVAESEIFTPETMQMIKEAKEKDQSAFQSYWEYDENDIDVWSKKQIDDDPCKQFVTYAENGHLSEMKILVKNMNAPEQISKCLSFKDSDGYTALHRAAYSNCLETVKYLLNLEIEKKFSMINQLEARTEMGWTPLHSAVYWNSYKVVEYLLKYSNADCNLKSNSGQTCLHLAAQQSKTKESLLLILTNPFVNFRLKNDQKESAYDIAIRSSKFNALFEITLPHLNEL